VSTDLPIGRLSAALSSKNDEQHGRQVPIDHVTVSGRQIRLLPASGGALGSARTGRWLQCREASWTLPGRVCGHERWSILPGFGPASTGCTPIHVAVTGLGWHHRDSCDSRGKGLAPLVSAMHSTPSDTPLGESADSSQGADLSGISEMFGLRDGQQAEAGTDTVGRWVAATEGDDQPPDVSSRMVHGRYRLIAELGVGGMGVTYRAWDTAAGIPVVVKMPRREVRSDSEALQRFAREMLTAVENGGAGRSKMVALGGVDLP
jgi:hypothetical protein